MSKNKFILIAIVFSISILIALKFAPGTVTAQGSGKNGELSVLIQAKRQEAAQLTRSEQAESRFQELNDKAQAGGLVPVIVRIRATFRPEGEFTREIEAQAQRALINEVQGELLKELVGYDPESVKQFTFIPFVAVRVSTTGLASLRQSLKVLDIQEDAARQLSLTESVALIGGTNAWASGFTGAGQTVAIIDTGVDKNHPFLAGKVVSEACFSTNNSSQSLSSLCPGRVAATTAANSGLPCSLAGVGCEHGTHVAGIAAGKGNSASGVAKDANLIAIQAFSRLDSTTSCSGGDSPCIVSFDSDLISALERVYELRNDYSIAAVNMSLGGGRFTSNCDASESSTKSAIDLLRSVGIATVVASGNNGYSNALSAPACISTAISVGSTKDYSSQLDQISSYSNSASFLNLLAPGEGITSSVPGGAYATFGGTSMAAPHVAGAWAIARQKAPTAGVADILAAMTSTGVSITDPRNGIRKPRIQIDAALGAIGNGEPSPTAPPAPSLLTATPVSSTQIDLSWTDNSTDETGFRIRRKTGSSGTWTLIATVGQNVSSYQNTGLTAGATYYYSVSSYNTGGESAASNEASATTPGGVPPPAAPTNLQATAVSKSQINLTWTDNATNETGFRIRRKTGSNGTWAEIATVGQSVTSYQNTGLSPAQTYFYSVTAYNATGDSTASNEASATTEDEGGPDNPPIPPTNLQGTAVSTTQINLWWIDNSAYETGFKVRRKAAGAAIWTDLATLGPNTTTYQDTGLTPGSVFVYSVIAFNTNGDSTSSNEATVSAPGEAFITLANGTPANGALARNRYNYYQINVPIGATQLVIQTAGTGNVDLYVKYGSQPQLLSYDCRSITTTSSDRCSFSLPPAGDWHIMVYGYANATSSFSVTATYQTGSPVTIPYAPTTLQATATSTTQIALAWTDNSANENGFRIRRKTGVNGTWAVIANVGVNVTTYQNTGLTAGTDYFYTVTAYNTGGESAATNEAGATTLGGEPTAPAAPSNLQAAAASASQVNLSWKDNSTNETGFKIRRKTGANGTWAEIATVGENVTTYQNTGLNAGTAYFYSVLAYNSVGDSAASNEATATTPEVVPTPPTNLQATAASGSQINLGWTDNSNNEAGFKIRRKTGASGTWAEIATVGQNVAAFQDNGLIGGLTYFYNVTAYNTAGESAPTNEASATTPGDGILPPAPVSNLQASSAATTKATLIWTDNSANETGFKIRRKTGVSGTWAEVGMVGQNVTSYQDTGLTGGATYYYTVSAYNVAGESGPSNEASVTTPTQDSLPLTNTVPVSGALGRNKASYYLINVPIGATSLTVQTTGAGNADLYLRFGSQPTLTAYDCRSIGTTSSDKCTVSLPAVGDWHIMVYGYSNTTSSFTLTATWK